MRADIVQAEETHDVQREIVLFGLKQLLHSMLNWGIVLALGVAWNMNFPQAIVFYAAYSLLRIFAGGFHAETRWGCYIASVFCISVCFACMRYLEAGTISSVVLNLVNIGIVFLLSPVENHKKPLSSTERILFRKRTRKMLLIESVFLLLTYCFRISLFTKAITAGICFVTVMVIAGIIQTFLAHSIEG